MKVTDIEVHEIGPEFEDWQAYQLTHHWGASWKRTVYVVHTDDGLVGLGESAKPTPQEVVEQYIGTSPFDWIGDETSFALGTAMYDLMGQAVGVPVHKLFGPKHRSWVPMGSWTVAADPQRMAEVVKHYAAGGFTWMKYHISPFENVFDQTEAMQAVAPEGFKIHYDFTVDGTTDHKVDLLERLAQYPIAGCFEDPLPRENLPGYVELRKRSRLPIVLHHLTLGCTHEVLMGAADIYMLGHSNIGHAVRSAGLFAAGNTPFMLQNVGGNITRAMISHMMATFPSAKFHFITTAEIYKGDVVNEPLEPVNGFLRVPEAPGLGVTLNMEELERLENRQVPENKRWIVKSQFKNGTKMYHIADPPCPSFLCRPDRTRHIDLSYDSPVSTEYWDDDGSPEYRAMFERLEREGMVLERG